MNEIVEKKEYELPAKFEDVASFTIFTQEKLKSVRAEISAIQRLGLAQEVLQQKIQEAQELAEIKTRAEMKLGELTAAIPTAQGERNDLTSAPRAQKLLTKSEALQKVNISHQKASQYELMAANPEIVERAIVEARANDDIISRSKVLSMIKAENRKVDIEKQIEEIKQKGVKAPDGLFDVIVMDPPWNYGTEYSATGRRVANPYPEMTQEELKAIKLPAAENCVLFLWTTHKFIRDAFELLDVYGFTYRNMLVWDKQKIGMGNLFRLRCEFCLVATKGKPIFTSIHYIEDVISEPRREHSRKPDAFYSIVNTLCVGRKLDYFSREKREGWEVFGNDTDKFGVA
ncbi:MAG: hypothetical protein IJP96_05180 [Synergistaceae bacterium]|nr:hypothetical protein [Synergistaceae bacterium]MBR0075124.1 hypothetical protein [Synergistaceae bacterium]MBR0079406.1 hypothetical protein [Synergistaceae bacterium]MBR0234354.1 hypothetical protein [Synergistaceae bacterium]MBR0253334.1 hypothetical protein [Synergistaceae bacterium]